MSSEHKAEQVGVLDFDSAFERLAEDDTELRKISPVEGAFGTNHSDYHNMWSLFTQLIERASVFNAHPEFFVGKYGINEKATNAWTKLLATAKSILEGLNKMRNNDKMTAALLENQTKAFSQSVLIDLGAEIKSVIEAVDIGEDPHETVLRLKKLLHRKIPELFLKSYTATMTSARDELHLLH